MASVPEVPLGTGCRATMPMLAMGTGMSPLVPETVVSAVLQAIQLGYRHFDTAFFYGSEEPLGQAIAEALRLGLIQSRSELFITSKLWLSDSYRDLVVPALQKSLRNLQLEYLDLYLVHWPLSAKPGTYNYPFIKEEVFPMDIKSVWEAMEECQRLGLAKSIGVSNFTCKKLTDLLTIAKIPPAVNQVEMSPIWQQKKLMEFCKNKGIHVTAYSPLGAVGNAWGTSKVMDTEVLKEISRARGKTVPQVALRWVYQQGACPIVKSFNKERMRENLDIFDWELDEEELEKISHIPQFKIIKVEELVSTDGPFKSLEELWDGEI